MTVLVRNAFGIEQETTEEIASEFVARGELEYVVEAPKKQKAAKGADAISE
jgi:hypothetical protein